MSEFESALQTMLQVIDSAWDNLTPEQITLMRKIESLIDDCQPHKGEDDLIS